jgi:hypothetical protein
MRGQRQEPPLLFGKDLGDGLIGVVGVPALMRYLIAPAAKLGIQIIDIGECPRGKNAWRRYKIWRSIFPFSFPRPGVQGRGAT